MDVLAVWDDSRLNQGSYLNVGNMWIRSTVTTQAFARVVENRSWVAWEQQIFNEEMNFDPQFASIECCHSVCMRAAAQQLLGRKALRDLPQKDARGTRLRVALEGADVCAAARTIGARGPPAGSPEPFSRVWRADEYNPETLMPPHRPVGRCNRVSSACLGWDEKHCQIAGGSAAATSGEPPRSVSSSAQSVAASDAAKLRSHVASAGGVESASGAASTSGSASFVLKQAPNTPPSLAQMLAIKAEAELARRDSLSLWPTVAAAGGLVKARLCPNGWGDRLLSLLAFATLRRLDGAAQLLLFWPEQERHGTAFDAVNRLSRVSHHFELADSVRLTTNWTAFVQSAGYWYEHDGPLSQDLSPRELSRRFNRSLPDVTRAYAEAQKQTVWPSTAIAAVLDSKLPSDGFTAVHLRRGDKMGVGLPGYETQDRYAVKPTQWHELTEITWQRLPAHGPILLCSDDDDERRALAARSDVV